jgi:hypothetical protein
MLINGESRKEVVRPDFNRARVDFRGARITSDTGFLLLREVDERFGIVVPCRRARPIKRMICQYLDAVFGTLMVVAACSFPKRRGSSSSTSSFPVWH